MATVSAGLLMYKRAYGKTYAFLVHPGGPFFKNKDKGWWTIPKGVPSPGESLLETGIREFREETGIAPRPPYIVMGSIKQKGGKVVYCWAFEGEWDETQGIKCNSFSLEWPPKSGNMVAFPEVDKAAWMDLDKALLYINEKQKTFLEKLRSCLA